MACSVTPDLSAASLASELSELEASMNCGRGWFPVSQCQSSTYEVLQLTNIAGPVMRLQLPFELWRDAKQALARFRLIFCAGSNSASGKTSSVRSAQRRHGERNDIQAVIKVGAEFSGVHERAKGAVGGGDDAPHRQPADECRRDDRLRAPAIRGEVWVEGVRGISPIFVE